MEDIENRDTLYWIAEGDEATIDMSPIERYAIYSCQIRGLRQTSMIFGKSVEGMRNYIKSAIAKAIPIAEPLYIRRPHKNG